MEKIHKRHTAVDKFAILRLHVTECVHVSQLCN